MTGTKRDAVTLDVVDMHTAGEPVRIVVGGYPRLEGASILDKRRDALERHDDLRRAMMHEPPIWSTLSSTPALATPTTQVAFW